MSPLLCPLSYGPATTRCDGTITALITGIRNRCGCFIPTSRTLAPNLRRALQRRKLICTRIEVHVEQRCLRVARRGDAALRAFHSCTGAEHDQEFPKRPRCRVLGRRERARRQL